MGNIINCCNIPEDDDLRGGQVRRELNASLFVAYDNLKVHEEDSSTDDEMDGTSDHLLKNYYDMLQNSPTVHGTIHGTMQHPKVARVHPNMDAFLGKNRIKEMIKILETETSTATSA